ncbi:MAG: SDR family oxidoreductase [Saccharofermentans sp.]|nr:SDR family oxidoreductase [Saccharofermentans sp.]
MSHVLVTGGSRGIGKAVCQKFLSEGYDVSYFYNSHIGEQNSHLLPIRCDVSNPVMVKESVKAAADRFGDIDVLISNSGISLTGLATDFGYEDYRRIMDINFGGLFNVSNEVIPSMNHNKKGVIVAISSMWGQTGASCEALYSATKGAVDAYVKSLAKELSLSGIRVNAVSPGCVSTDMMSCYSDEDIVEIKKDIPAGRIATPDEIAESVYFLASDEASYITGQILGVNGGFLI